uniref:Uncharacterized protein n=1 Tax=Romanomermis culicivorax TaxID=13658 RepID=A0A915JJR9_ROMCU
MDDRRNVNDHKVLDTGVTVAYLEQTLRDYFHRKDARFEKWDFELLEGGFSSKIIRVRLKWVKNDPPILPVQIVVKATSVSLVDEIFDKISNYDEKKDEQKSEHRTTTVRQIVQMINRTECETYKILSAAQGAVAIPRIYGCEPGIIVMEDMGTRAGICENLGAGTGGTTMSTKFGVQLHQRD